MQYYLSTSPSLRRVWNALVFPLPDSTSCSWRLFPCAVAFPHGSLSSPGVSSFYLQRGHELLPLRAIESVQSSPRSVTSAIAHDESAGDDASKQKLSIEKEMSEELDDNELDALFEEHGEVVVADTNPLPASAEVDADSQSLALAVALAEAANDTKAVDILVLHVKPLVYWTRFFVIATAFSRPQLAAIAKKMQDVGSERFEVQPRGDLKPTSWTLLDYGDVVVHVFLPKERAFYNLEEFYGNAPVVPLSFNTSNKAESAK